MGYEDGNNVWRGGMLDGGLVTSIPAHKLRAHQTPGGQNFDPTYTGSVRKRLGYAKFTAAALGSPTGTFVSGLHAGVLGTTNYVVAANGTALYDITAGNWSTAITGATITVDTPVRMRIFNDKFLICNVGGGPYTWAGTGAVAALAGSPPANAQGVEIHRSRVWMWKGTDSVMYWSALSNEADWTTTDNAGNFVVNKGDGYVLNGMISGGDFAIISKRSPSTTGTEGALYILYGSSPFDYVVRKIATVGAYSQEAMVAYDDWVAVATPRGIYGIQGKKKFKLSDPIQPTYDDIPSKGTICAGRYKNTLRFAYPASGTANNRELVLDVERGVWGYNTGKTIRIYANHPNGNLQSGTSGTSILVWTEDSGTNDDGAAINFYWETPDMYFDVLEAAKRLNSFHVHAKNTGSYTLAVEHYIEGTAQSYGDTMAVATEGPVKKFVMFNKIGNKHRMRITNNAADQAIEIYDLEAYARVFEPGSKVQAK